MRLASIGTILSTLALFIILQSSFFISMAHAQVCTIPTSAPDLYQVSRNGTSATLYFTPINDQITGYTIMYGLSAGDERYSATMSSGTSTGAVSYVVSDLDPAQTYFFKVRADTTCGSSPWSGWVGDSYTPSDTSIAGVSSGSAAPAKAVGGVQIPVTGPEALLYALAIPLAGILVGFFLFTFPLKKR